MQQKKKRKLTKRKLERKKIKMVSNPVSSDKRKTRKRHLRGGEGGGWLSSVDSANYDFPEGDTFRNPNANVNAKVRGVRAKELGGAKPDNSNSNGGNPFNLNGQNPPIRDPDDFYKPFNRRVIGGMVVFLAALAALAPVVAQ